MSGLAAGPALAAPAAWVTALLRWLLLCGLATALGGTAGRGLARRFRGTRPAALPGPCALRGSLAGAAAAAGRLRQAGLGVTALLGVVAAEGLRAHPEHIIPVAGALITYCHLTAAAL